MAAAGAGTLTRLQAAEACAALQHLTSLLAHSDAQAIGDALPAVHAALVGAYNLEAVTRYTIQLDADSGIDVHKGLIPDSLALAWCRSLSDDIVLQQRPGFQYRSSWLCRDCRCQYNYGGTEWEARPYSPAFANITQRVFRALGEPEPDSAVVNYYHSKGQHIEFHADDEARFGGKTHAIRIISLSIGGARFFEVKKKRRNDTTWLPTSRSSLETCWSCTANASNGSCTESLWERTIRRDGT